MKKTTTLLAVLFFSMVLFSCENNSNADEALYDNINTTDDDEIEPPQDFSTATDDDEIEPPQD